MLGKRIDEGFFGQVFKASVCLSREGKCEKVVAAVKMLKSKCFFTCVFISSLLWFRARVRVCERTKVTLKAEESIK